MPDIPDERQLVFTSDPERFIGAIKTDDREARRRAFQYLDDFAICEIVRFCLKPHDNDRLGDMLQLYDDEVMALEPEHRLSIYGHINGLVQNTSLASVNAFMPFILRDTVFNVVATAVLDYVSLAPLTDNDPMSRPKDITGLIELGAVKNKGAAFGGLLFLGDRRVNQLLWPLRNRLDDHEVNEAIRCTTGYLYSATVDFLIDWLSEMDGDGQNRRYGSVSSGIALCKRHNRFDIVLTGERPFPYPTMKREEWEQITRPIPVADYVKQVAPRLYALERAEPPPRIMPAVLREWGLEPSTSPDEAAR
jgi:hypothetical protein